MGGYQYRRRDLLLHKSRKSMLQYDGTSHGVGRIKSFQPFFHEGMVFRSPHILKIILNKLIYDANLESKTLREP